MKKLFDYIVIGGGSGGLSSARRAAKYGKKVCLIESGQLGGTCVNRGCVPKKIMWNAASMLHDFKISSDYGIHSQSTFDWPTLVKNRNRHISDLNTIYASNLSKDKISVIQGRASFKDPQTVHVEGEGDLSAPHILIASGTKPIMPEIPGKNFLSNSDDFFALETPPKKALVIGNGYIASELTGMMNALGIDTSLSLRHEQFLKAFDSSLSKQLKDIMESEGVTFLPGRTITEAKQDRQGLVAVFDTGEEVKCDNIFMCIGRNANLDGLNLQNTGVELSLNGFISTDENEETNVKGLYSIGDVNGKVLLTPVAVAAGRALADRLFGGIPDARMDYNFIPTVMFTHPPLGSIGLSEEKARSLYGDEVRIYSTKFNNLFYSVSSHKIPTVMKLVCLGSEEKVIGLHGLGRGIDEIIQGFSVALKIGASKKDLERTVAIHPTAAEEFVTMS